MSLYKITFLLKTILKELLKNYKRLVIAVFFYYKWYKYL